MTQDDIASHLGALRSRPDVDSLADKISEADADLDKWRRAEREADLALSKARIQAHRAETVRDTLFLAERQTRAFVSRNPFLFSENMTEAAAAATVPALTASEVASIEDNAYPEAEARRVREWKLNIRKQPVTSNAYPNRLGGVTNCDVKMK